VGIEATERMSREELDAAMQLCKARKKKKTTSFLQSLSFRKSNINLDLAVVLTQKLTI
jgi:hypothetical protein